MRFFNLLIPLAPLLAGVGVAIWLYYQTGDNGSTVAVWSFLGLLAIQSLILFREKLPRLQSLPANAFRLGALDVKPDTTEWILEALAGGIVTVNEAGKVLYINQSAERLIGCDSLNALNKPLEKLFNIEDSNGKPLIPQVLASHNEHPQNLLQFGQVKLFPHSGEVSFVEFHTTHLQDENKTLVLILRDVTTDRKVINRLYQQASHDALTGLMNRRSFEEYIEQLAHNNVGSGQTNVLVSIDLDNFKVVNDTCGHQAGDELLRQVAQMLKRFVRQSDRVARLGGDEFAISLENCAIEKGRKIMDAIIVELRNYRFSWEGKVFSISGSMGLVEFIPSGGLSVKELFADADKACYTAKALGRNQTFVHLNSGQGSRAGQRRTDWGRLLEKAMEDDRFILFVQPIVPLQAERAFTGLHYEVLVRLPFRKQLLSPGSFLPAADRLDMMSKIDRWIIQKVLETMGEHRFCNAEGVHSRFMINLSAQAVQDTGLFEFIETNAKRFAVDPAVLCFEIAESVAIANFVQTKFLMRALDALGCRLVLDDFGSGFSSLNYVRDLPLSYLKIDGNFVHNLVSNPIDAAMVKAVHEVGQVMHLMTIAELVEDAETLSSLLDIGVDFAQGYHCGKPFPFRQLYGQKTGTG